jgi:hypothetical protein
LSAAFDEPNLVGSAGLVPALALAERAGLNRLADEWLTVPGSAGTAGAKLATLVGGMLAGADSIDDLDVLPSTARASRARSTATPASENSTRSWPP